MLKPQRRSDFLLPDVPPVFGKPWFWHRSSGTMETSRSLAQVIMEMQDEIQTLDGDKRGRREDSFGNFPGPTREIPRAAGLENPYANLRRNASAPALDVQYKGRRRLSGRRRLPLVPETDALAYGSYCFTRTQENTVMTVRRYSIAAHLPGGSGAEGSSTSSRRSGSGWGRLQEEVHPGSTDTRSKKQTLQDLVQKSR